MPINPYIDVVGFIRDMLMHMEQGKDGLHEKGIAFNAGHALSAAT
jgi:hypothetical protein